MASSPTDIREVYRLEFDANRYAALVPVDEADYDWRAPFDGRPVGSDWSPPLLYWETEDDKHPIGDYSTFSGEPVFSDRAVDILDDLLDGRGELLPLAVAGSSEGRWWLFNITRLSDALDEQHSELRYFDDGRILGIDRWEFHSDRLAGETIFRPARKLIYPCVTDAFRERVEQAQLTGWVWDRQVWPQRPTLQPPMKPAPDDGDRVFTRLVPDENEFGDPYEVVVHRIVPAFEADNTALIKAQDRANRLGIGPDDGPNGCFLARGIHRAAYTETYLHQLNTRLAQADTKEEGEAILRHIGRQLEAGEFPTPTDA